MSLRVSRGDAPMPGCGGPLWVRDGTESLWGKRTTESPSESAPPQPTPFLGAKKTLNFTSRRDWLPLTCSQGPVPNERSSDLP